MDQSLQFQIEHQPDFATLRVQLAPGQSMLAEPSAMATMSANVKLVSSVKGGAMGALSRTFSGERCGSRTGRWATCATCA